MQRIPISLVRPGMKLAKPVTRDNGMVVMGAGMELTESHIERLRNMDIDRITVDGNPLEGACCGVDTSASRRLERMGSLFRRLDDPFMGQVKAHLEEYFRLRAAEQAVRAAAEKG